MTAIKRLFSQQPVTLGLLVLNLLVFIAMQLAFPFRGSSGEAIFVFGGLYGDYIRLVPTALWRLLSSNFVHIGFEHLLMNSISLYIVGQIAEQVWRMRDYVILYLLAGVFGGILTLLLSPSSLSAGASSSIFGLFAGVAVLGYFGRNPILKQMGKSFQTMILVNLVFNLFMPSVNIWGHLGGAVGGAMLALILPNRLADYRLSISQRWGLALVFMALQVVGLFLFFR